jgi:hypothetical protein
MKKKNLMIAAYTGGLLCVLPTAAFAQAEPANDNAPPAPPASAPAPTATSETAPAAAPAPAATPAADATPPATPVPAPPPDPAPAEAETPMFTARLYGFIESLGSFTGNEPNGNINADGSPSRQGKEVDLAIPAFHIMAQGTISSRFRWYFNLAAPNADQPTIDTALGIRNAWLEASIFGDYLNVRLGKMYRRFGQYNEILDTVPSFIGVETPVWLSGNRPMLTRTTNAMVHGRAPIGDGTLQYSVTAGKDEQSANDDVWTPGFDLNYDWNSTVLIGTSGYTTLGTVTPSVDLGAGSPAGGVAPWMQQDRYSVFGGYGKLSLGSFFVGTEFWISPHDATRDPAKVITMSQNASNFSDVNRARFGVTGSNPTADQVIKDVKYTYTTFDVRAGYTFDIGSEAKPMELTPFVDVDYVRNRESISAVEYGGDGQPGESPRGIMMHYRLGAVWKPVPQVAVKGESGYAIYDYGSQGFVGDPELWLSLSYQWELFRK